MLNEGDDTFLMEEPSSVSESHQIIVQLRVEVKKLRGQILEREQQNTQLLENIKSLNERIVSEKEVHKKTVQTKQNETKNALDQLAACEILVKDYYTTSNQQLEIRLDACKGELQQEKKITRLLTEQNQSRQLQSGNENEEVESLGAQEEGTHNYDQLPTGQNQSRLPRIGNVNEVVEPPGVQEEQTHNYDPTSIINSSQDTDTVKEVCRKCRAEIRFAKEGI